MKRLIKGVLLLSFGIMLIACSNTVQTDKRGSLNEIEVQQKGVKNENILDSDNLSAIESAFENVEWQPNTKVDMVRQEDVTATFIYKGKSKKVEQKVVYQIWFEENDFVTIASDDEREGYGKLNPTNAMILKNLMFLE